MKLSVPLQSKEIRGTDGFYRIDVFGQVWTCRARGFIKNRKGPWKKKTPAGFDRGGYPTILLWLNGKSKWYRIHRLVLETFRGPRLPGQVCRHFPDPDRKNNQLSNLQWGTPKENTHDRRYHGTYQTGEKNPAAKLTWKTVREIRGRYCRRNGRVLARFYGISVCQLMRVVKGDSWKEMGV
jgi:hypothetical protein